MSTYIMGIDLGQLGDRTALSIVERSSPALVCRHLQTWAPGTHHTKVLEDTLRLVPLLGSDVQVALDISVAGNHAGRLFRTALSVKTTFFTITGGTSTEWGAGGVRVPKRDLASILRALLEAGLLQVSKSLPHAATLEGEMRDFKVAKITNDDTLDWRQRAHDDLVLATAIACWLHDHNSRLSEANIIPPSSGHSLFWGRN